MSTIKIKRGSGTTPTLADGELGFNKDTKVLSVGTGSKNIDVGRPILPISQNDYNNLTTKDDKTIYIIQNDDAVVTESILEEAIDGRLQHISTSDLKDYGIDIQYGTYTMINATLEEVCAALPDGSLYVNGWIGNTKNSSTNEYNFGSIGQQMPGSWGKLYIHKASNSCADLKFVMYEYPTTYVSTWTTTNSKGWSGWECVNPRMTLGTEYRTTERYNGKPVYAKLVNVGTMPNDTLKSVAHGCVDVQDIVSLSGSARTSSGSVVALPSAAGYSCDPDTGSLGIHWAIGATENNLFIVTQNDRTSWTGKILIKFTKTTD